MAFTSDGGGAAVFVVGNGIATISFSFFGNGIATILFSFWAWPIRDGLVLFGCFFGWLAYLGIGSRIGHMIVLSSGI